MTTENRPYPVKDTFVLYRSYLKHLDLLSNDDRGIWITAILHYVNGLPLPEMTPAVSMAFSFVKERLDEDYEKWQRTIDAKRAAGAIGGIASGISRRVKSEASASSASKNEANEHDNDYVYVNDYDNDTVYVNDHNPYIHDRKQSLKEARRGMERDIDYDAVLLEQIRNRGSRPIPAPQDDDLEDLGIPKPAEGR